MTAITPMSIMPTFSPGVEIRGIAQSGSAPALGAGCREFESLYPDQIFACIGFFQYCVGPDESARSSSG